MRVLIIGGSRFVGRAVAAAALAAGHRVTVFNRGRSGPDVPGVEAVRGDRESGADLARLTEGREWDAVIDTCGYVPRVVGRSVRALADRAECYLFVSTCSVFSEYPARPIRDDSPVFGCPADARRDDGDYGTLKAGCEQAVLTHFPGRVLLIRPGIIIGPHEDVGRLPAWLARIADAGERPHRRRVLAPGDPDRAMRLIDARDLAAFCLDAVDRGLRGAYTVTGPAGGATYGGWLAACAAATGADAEFEWVDDDFLIRQGVGIWAELPLWAPAAGPDFAAAWDIDTSRAEAAGLRCRPLAETVADTWAWLSADGGRVLRRYEPSRPHGLSEEREAELFAVWDARG